MWYYLRNQQRHGPFAAAEIKRLARTGKLMPDDLVMREGAERRFPARSIRGLFPDPPVPEATAPTPSPWGGLPLWGWILVLVVGVAVPAIALVSHIRHREAVTPPAVVVPAQPFVPLPSHANAPPPPKRFEAPPAPLPPPGPELLVWPRILQRERIGPPVFPRSREEISTTLARLEAPPAAKLSKRDAEHAAALSRLKAYRYLAGLPYENLVLDPELTRTSQAGAELCQKAQVMSHYPKNPGLPEEVYEFGKRGTSQSNLGEGYGGLVEAMDGWLDDSDSSNIDHVGHRRWCLNPHLLKTGLGRAGDYQAMWAMDASQPSIPDYTIVPYPAHGYMPTRYFAAHAAWSVSFNPDRFRFHDQIQASIFPADAQWRKAAQPLPLNFHRVDIDDFGIACCVIFRPPATAVAPGKRYLVLLEGLRNLRGEPLDPIEYPVEFVANK